MFSADVRRVLADDLSRYSRGEWLHHRGLWAVVLYRIGHSAHQRAALGGGLRRLRANVVVLGTQLLSEVICGVELPAATVVGPGFRIAHGGGIVIHPRARVGANCTLRQGVTLGNRRDGGGCPVLEDGVSLGAHAQVLGEIRVGEGARIGAMALVLSDVPRNAIAVGSAARVIPGAELGPEALSYAVSTDDDVLQDVDAEPTAPPPEERIVQVITHTVDNANER